MHPSRGPAPPFRGLQGTWGHQRKGGRQVPRCPRQASERPVIAKRGPTGSLRPLQIPEAPWDKRGSLRGQAELYRTLWKAVSVGASWSGRGFRWELSTAVRTIQTQSYLQGDSSGSCLEVELLGSLAGLWCEWGRSVVFLGVSVCPRENKGLVIKSLDGLMDR